MILHIVKNNERISGILEAYGLTFEEIYEYNRHITDFNNLICGTKLWIPLLSEEISDILDNSEGFVDNKISKLKDIEITEEKSSNEAQEKNIIKPKNDERIKLKAYPGILPPKSLYEGNEIPK